MNYKTKLRAHFLVGILLGVLVMIGVAFVQNQITRIERIENFLTAVSAGR